MDIWETDKLLLFLAFVGPGLISLKTYELIYPGTNKEVSQQILDSVVYSSINYALLLWPIYEIETQGVRATSPRGYIFFYFTVLFIAPILWVFAFSKFRTSNFLKGKLSHPSGKPWDYVFSKCIPYYIITTLKDDRKIAGFYGYNSFVSSAPNSEQIYLEETWLLNNEGGFDRPQNDTAGVIILSSDIVKIELFKITYGDKNDK